MYRFKRISDLLARLAEFRKEIEFLFERRNKTIRLDDFLQTVLDYDEDKLHRLLELGFAQHTSSEYINLSSDLQDFLERVANVTQEINNEYIRGKIETLKNNIEFFENEDDCGRAMQYVEHIRSELTKIASDVFFNALRLQQLVKETYETEPNFRIKKQKLNIFESKLKDLSDLIGSFSIYLQSAQWEYFQHKAADRYLDYLVDTLSSRFIEAREIIISTLQRVIEYHNIFRYESELVRKIRKLKELKDQHELKSKTDIIQVLAKQNATFWQSGERISLFIDLQIFEHDDLLPLLRKVAIKSQGKIKDRRERIGNVLINQLSLSTKTQPAVNYQQLWRIYQARGGEVMEFLLYTDKLNDKSIEEKISIFVKFVSRFSHRLEFDGHKRYSNYSVAIAKLKSNTKL